VTRDVRLSAISTGHIDSGCATAGATVRRSIDVALRHATFRIYHTALFTPRSRKGEQRCGSSLSFLTLALNEYECSASRPGRLTYWIEPLCGHQSQSGRFGDQSNPLSCRDFAGCSTVHDKLTVPQLVKKQFALYETRRFITVSTTARHLSLL